MDGQGNSFMVVKKCRWLVNLVKNGQYTYPDIEKKWNACFDQDGSGLSRRTFANMIGTIKLCGIEIRFDRIKGYYVCTDVQKEDEEMSSVAETIRELLTEDVCQGNSMKQKSLDDRILEEDMPSKGEYYDIILERIRRNETITLSYRSYRQDGMPLNYTIEPYALKQFKRRWYLFGKHRTESFQNPDLRNVPVGWATLSLDRIVHVNESDAKPFDFPSNFNARRYFADYFGTITYDKNGPFVPENVLLKVYTKNNKHRYLEDLPLHHSQSIEKHDGDGYWLFRYRLATTYDFIQELLMHREDVEVLEPLSLRRKMAEALYRTAEHYQAEIKSLKQKSGE